MEDDAFEDIGSAAARVVKDLWRVGQLGDSQADDTAPDGSLAAIRNASRAFATARHSGTAAGTEKGVAPAGGGPASAAQAGTGEARRAHNSGGGTAVVLEFRLRERTTARAVGSPAKCVRV